MKKLTTKDLRVGNYLNIHGLPNPIGVGFLVLLEENHPQLPPYEPIELTSEILIKVGFLKISMAFYINDSYYFNIFYRRLEYLNNVIKSPEIQYLHQLQNIYYFLTGEELIINL